MKTPLCTTLKSLVSWMPYNSAICGGMKIPSLKWYKKQYSRRQGMELQLAITAICNQNLN